jgi:hypothetical protein
MATLSLRRADRFFGRKHAWQVMIDGKPTGSIADGDAVRLTVEPRHHILRLRSPGRFTSPVRSFEAADGDVVSFTCHAPLLWPQAAAAVIVPGRWISLRQE